MKCNSEVLDCVNGDCTCEEQKNNYETCCPKDCRCMTDDEHEKIKNDKEIKEKADDYKKQRKDEGKTPRKYLYALDRNYIKKLLETQYKDIKGKDCEVSREKCQEKSKCHVMSYKDSKSTSSKKGCCSGQTGHHIVPGCVFSPVKYRYPINEKKLNKPIVKAGGKTKTLKKWQEIATKNGGKDYSKKVHGDMPTICVAGGSHSIGTHGLMHAATEMEIDKLINNKDKKFNKNNVIDACIKAHFHVYNQSNCDKKCLKDDLEREYGDLGNDESMLHKTSGCSPDKEKATLRSLVLALNGKVRLSLYLIKHLYKGAI